VKRMRKFPGNPLERETRGEQAKQLPSRGTLLTYFLTSIGNVTGNKISFSKMSTLVSERL
jgi:hypothetical protein